MSTENTNNPRNETKRPRRRHGKSALLFAFLLGAGSMFGLSHLGSAHAHGPFGPPGGSMAEMGDLGFGGPGGFDNNAKQGHWKKRFAAMREKRLAHMLDEVDATDQQREQIKSALSNLKSQVEPLRAEGKAHRETMRDLMTAEQMDTAEIEQERKAMIDLADRLSRQVTATMTGVSNLLEPEQRKQLAEMLQKRFH